MATKWLSDDERVVWRDLMLMNLQLNARLNRELAPRAPALSGLSGDGVTLESTDSRVRVVELGEELGWEKSRIRTTYPRMWLSEDWSKEALPHRPAWNYVVLTANGRRAITGAAPTMSRRFATTSSDVVQRRATRRRGRSGARRPHCVVIGSQTSLFAPAPAPRAVTGEGRAWPERVPGSLQSTPETRRCINAIASPSGSAM